MRIGNVIVPAFADRDALEQVVAAIQRLPQLQQICFALQLDAELAPHIARSAVAADEILRLQLHGRAVATLHARAHGPCVLLEIEKFASVAHIHAGQGLGDRLQQWLERVLRDQLVRLERHRAIGTRRNLGLRLCDRRVRQMQQRRLDQRGDDEHIHRHVAREAGIADFLRDAEPAVDLHGAGVAPLHLGQKLRRVLLLEQDAAHAAAAKIDGEREPDRAGADNDDLRVQLRIPRPVKTSDCLAQSGWVGTPATPKRDRRHRVGNDALLTRRPCCRTAACEHWPERQGKAKKGDAPGEGCNVEQRVTPSGLQ